MHTVFCRNIIDYGLVNIYKYLKQQKKFIILIFKIVDFVLQWYTASDNESYIETSKDVCRDQASSYPLTLMFNK